MGLIRGADFSAVQGIGRSDHPPRKRNQWYGLGRGGADHPPRRNITYGVGGVRGAAADWWSNNLDDLLDFGRDIFGGGRDKPPTPAPLPPPPPPPVKETDWTPALAVGGGVLVLVLLASAFGGRGSRSRR